MKAGLLFFMMAVTFVPSPGSEAQTGSPTLRKIAAFDLPGPAGKRFDYLTIDPDDPFDTKCSTHGRRALIMTGTQTSGGGK